MLVISGEQAAIPGTLTWLPDCFQGDVGLPRAWPVSSVISWLSLLFVLGEGKEEGNEGPCAPAGPDSLFSGPVLLSHSEGKIPFTCQPVGWSHI